MSRAVMRFDRARYNRLKGKKMTGTMKDVNSGKGKTQTGVIPGKVDSPSGKSGKSGKK